MMTRSCPQSKVPARDPARPAPRSIHDVRVLRISVTDVCNLRCVYCMPAAAPVWLPKEQILTYEEIVEVVRMALDCGIRQFKLTGGEPLARRDLPELVAQLGRLKDDGLDDLSLTTNGTLLARHARRLRDAGLDRITVSLDTLQPRKFRRITGGGELDRVLEGLEAACAAGFDHPKLNVVVVQGINDREITDFARLTLDRPLTVRFIEYMPLGHSALPQPKTFVSAEQIIRRIAPLGPLQPADPDPGSGPARLLRLRGGRGKIGLIDAMSHPFCQTCNRLRLTADGRLRSCLFDGGDVPLRRLLRPRPDHRSLIQAFHACARMKPARHGARGRGQMSRIGG